MYKFNQIPSRLKNNDITIHEASNLIAEFVIKNQPLFNLDSYDDDFKSEIYLRILESGSKIFSSYEPESGSFFSYFYCCLLSMISTQIKKEAIKSLNFAVISDECIKNYDEKIISYSNINTETYAAEKQKIESTLKGKLCYKTTNINKKDKMILVIALKSSFFITDEQIKRVAKIYNLTYSELYDVIQKLKEDLLYKQDRKTMYVERRNKAYYYHKRYENQIDRIKKSKEELCKESLLKNLYRKNELHEKRWQNYNKKLQNGYIHIRPSNKTIAGILGICERQVAYYLFCGKNTNKTIEFYEKPMKV